MQSNIFFVVRVSLAQIHRAYRPLVLVAVTLAVLFTGWPAGAQTVNFGKSILAGPVISNPTSMQFGPDGLLYVAMRDALIKSYTITRNSENDYTATLVDTITSIKAIPNHNDDGSPNETVMKRLITGILVVGTAANPVIYVNSSDPRMGGGSSGFDRFLDTNSGILSRLTWNGWSWDKLDLIRGLPRSEENHANNGMQLDHATNTLFIAQGGNTNQGAPSHHLINLPEYALSAAILSVDLDAIGEATYDLPTLDDEDRPGDPDFNDPFGGNNGKNQAKLVPGGPIQIHSPGWRNIYDLVITRAGRMYTIDNGPNENWGHVPENEGPEGNCTNAIVEPGYFTKDNLHFVSGPGYYGGHPNPTRANPANVFNPTQPQSPVPWGNPVECDYRDPGVEDGALAVFQHSTNGIAEYTATNFGGALDGDLLAASFKNAIYRIKLNESGDTAVLVEELFSDVGTTPLDVIARGDADSFPGTIWVADYGASVIQVFEPADAESCTVDADCDDGAFCTGTETCEFGLCAPGTTGCPTQVCDEDADVCLPIPSGDALVGGLLYDKWWAENGATEPSGKHPLYPQSGGKSGSTTYRCKECHGWDYKGVNGAYGSGSHYTGIGGVLGSSLSPGEMFDLIKSDTVPGGHGFGGHGLSDVDIADLVQFLQDRVIDVDPWIDGDGIFVGDEVAGESRYTDGGPNAPCSACHGDDGTGINFGTPEDPQWVGTIAWVNPWEAMHKMRFGQPGSSMPGALGVGAVEQELADIGRYIQLNLPVECTNEGHCDDDNTCTTDSCATGFCESTDNSDACDDGLACTTGETCSDGECVGGTPNDSACDDDGNVCTTDSCDVLLGCINVAVTGSCDDGVDCTSNDSCNGGVCGGTDNCSAGQVCDVVMNRCDAPPTDDDNDGLFGYDDPCPAGPRNRCFGAVAVDQTFGTPIRINTHVGSASCSGQKTDCNGDVWYADFGFNLSQSAAQCNLNGGGSLCFVAGIDTIFGCDASEGDTQDIFRCEHSDHNKQPELAYNFDLPNGDYVVNLFFANTYDGTTEIGSRVFDIVVEGSVVYAGFDQVAESGGPNVAVVRSAVVTVDDGDGLQIEFLHSVENPAVKGIEVLQMGGGVTTTTVTTGPTTTTTLPCDAYLGLKGDCNQIASLEAADPICTALCLVGTPPSGSDCVCAADCNCVSGTEVSDPLCTALRLLDIFEPDTCATGGAQSMVASRSSTLESATGESNVVVRLSERHAARFGRSQRVIRVARSDTSRLGGARFAVRSESNIDAIRLSRRLRRRGFSLTIGKTTSTEWVAVIGAPVTDQGALPMRRGRVVRIVLESDDAGLTLLNTELGSIGGLPLVPKRVIAPAS